MIFERRNIPKVVTSTSLPKNVLKRPETIDEQQVPDTSSDLQPSSEWQKMQTEIFTKLHDKVGKLRLKRSSSFSADSPYLQMIQNEEETLDYCKSNEPLLTFFLDLGQRKLELLLSYFSNNLEDLAENPTILSEIQTNPENFSWITKWIYSALACLQKPLEGHILNDLRVIAKSSIKIRNNLKEQEQILVPYNLLICIVAFCFDQFDLADH